MSLKDTFGQLKTAVVGTKTSNIDAKLDSAVRDIVSFKSQSGRNGYIDLLRTIISKGGNLEISGNMFQQLPTPAVLGQGSRLLRYKAYEAITSNISYCKRAVDVLVDNILSPDDITKISLDIKPKTYLENASENSSYVKNVEEIVVKTKLESKLDLVVKNTLQLGDFFCEIANAKTALISKSAYLAEARGEILLENFTHFEKDIDTAKDKFNLQLEFKEGVKEDYSIILDFSSIEDITTAKSKSLTSFTTDTPEEKKDKEPEDIYLLYYEPKRVVKLQSDMYPLCFGYLVFPSAVLAPHLMLQNQAVNNLCQSILRSLQKKIPELNNTKIDQNDLRDTISMMVKEGDPSKSMNIRYVPPDKMVHFHIPSTKYYPYGESIFDPVQFSAKVLIALETALTIHRLNRSTEKRKVSVEIGLPRDARKAIEKLKEEFRKRKICLDSFGSVDTIPSMINTFEDVYIPQKDGKAFVDISTFNEGNVDVRGKVDELKFLRDQLVAALGVPAPFLNIEENLSNKNALSEENILFARTIVNHQKYLTSQINELIEKIYRVVDPEKALTVLDNVTIAFAPPKSLQFERESKYLGDLAQLVETLERVGIPREWSTKKYLTSIDWDEVKKFMIDKKVETNLKTNQVPGEEAGAESGMGGMGGLGGGGIIPTGGGMM